MSELFMLEFVGETNTFSLLTAVTLFAIWTGACHLLHLCASLPCCHFSEGALGLCLSTGWVQGSCGPTLLQGCPRDALLAFVLGDSSLGAESAMSSVQTQLLHWKHQLPGPWEVCDKVPFKTAERRQKTLFHLRVFPKLCSRAAASAIWLSRMEMEAQSHGRARVTTANKTCRHPLTADQTLLRGCCWVAWRLAEVWQTSCLWPWQQPELAKGIDPAPKPPHSHICLPIWLSKRPWHPLPASAIPAWGSGHCWTLGSPCPPMCTHGPSLITSLTRLCCRAWIFLFNKEGLD